MELFHDNWSVEGRTSFAHRAASSATARVLELSRSEDRALGGAVLLDIAEVVVHIVVIYSIPLLPRARSVPTELLKLQFPQLLQTGRGVARQVSLNPRHTRIIIMTRRSTQVSNSQR